MSRIALLCVIGITVSVVSQANDTTDDKTSLKVYPVGDIVSIAAMNNCMGGKATSQEWASEYPKTIKALDDLQTIVESMCEVKPVGVRAYAPSLSLIVRHTEAGHQEIDQLLRSLSEENSVSIRMNCRPLYGDDSSELINEKMSAQEKDQLNLLLRKQRLTESETADLLALLPARPEYDAFNQHVELKAGHRTPWGPQYRPCTAMGRVDRTTNSVQIRIDFISDDYAEATPFGSQVFSLGEGESAFLHHYCDGGTTVWLVTADIVTTEKSEGLSLQEHTKTAQPQ